VNSVGAATPTAQPGVSSAEDVIRQHYALIAGRDFDRGYLLMSARLSSANSLDDYRG